MASGGRITPIETEQARAFGTLVLTALAPYVAGPPGPATVSASYRRTEPVESVEELEEVERATTCTGC
jgi:hypothetical protein